MGETTDGLMTRVRVGDVLVAVEGLPVAGKNALETMRIMVSIPVLVCSFTAFEVVRQRGAQVPLLRKARVPCCAPSNAIDAPLFALTACHFSDCTWRCLPVGLTDAHVYGADQGQFSHLHAGGWGAGSHILHCASTAIG